MKYTLLSSKGQLTIHKSIQKNLGIAPRSKLALYQERNYLIIKPLTKSIVDETAGSLTNSVPKDKLGIPWEKVREETHRLAAEEIAKEGL